MMIMGMDAGSFGYVIFVLIVDLLLAIIPARIAKKKGYSYAGFYVFGVFLWLIALIVSLVISDKNKSNAQDILAYKQLLDSGAITQEEYDRKKAELLD